MKRISSIIFALAVPLSVCFAHDHSLSLAQGQMIVGWNFYVSSSNSIEQFFHDSNGYVESVTVNFSSEECRTAWAGDSVSFEYAVFDGVSFGLKTNLTTMLVWAIRDGFWEVQGALFSTVNFNTIFGIASSFPFVFLWNEELQLAPIYTTQPVSGDGLMNLFTTISSNFKAMSISWLDLYIYLDFKTITSFLHPYYTFNWMTDSFYKDNIEVMGYSTDTSFKVFLHPVLRTVAAVGVDAVLFKNILLFVGINFPILRLEGDESGAPMFFWGGDRPPLDLGNWEFELKFKL